MEWIIIIIFGALLMACSVAIGISLEEHYYNNGICRHCGKPLRYFDTDSQGGRGYCCDDCGYHTWVSYKTVDKNYKGE